MNSIYVLYEDKDEQIFNVSRHVVYTSNELPVMINLMNKLVQRTMQVAELNTLEGTKEIYNVRNYFRYSVFKCYYNAHTGAKISEAECIRSVNVIDTWGFCPEEPIEQYRPPPRKRVRFEEDVPSNVPGFNTLTVAEKLDILYH